ncbi:NADP-dependent oxidoreductase [Nevskia soli]|uniref:NADP-dependent oxidoreductase n=1 Tax=Nevskia soli TaxID=418856 RepID=UPI0004A73362|nr:NADP-dependent oxidoreductase [Nevskia soli]
MLPTRNRQILLHSRPNGIPQAENFRLAESTLPPIGDGQVLVRHHFLSVDPAMRGWVNAVTNYSDLVPIGGVMRAFAAGDVIESHHPDYKVGDYVVGMLGWQEYSVVSTRAIRYKIAQLDLPLSLYLGALGLNGITAYIGLTKFGEPKPGDTVVVSSAAGSVGSAVGQIAKALGCRAVGIAGGPQKVRWCLDEFGFDAAVDYKSPTFVADLQQACPQGVDVYFDNTSGAISDAVLNSITFGARIVICGTASVASWDPWPAGPRPERHLLVKRAKMQGFINLDHDDLYAESVEQLSAWVRNGQLHYREDILEGLEQAPGSIADLYTGANAGKRLIRLKVV